MGKSDQYSKKTIMVVDDDESVKSFLAFSLKSEGFQVMEVIDAETVLSLIKTRKPDLILLDIMLPKMDGITLCRKLREKEDTAKIPILFITAYGEPNGVQRAKEVGAQGLIEKPIMFDELLMQVLDALNGNFSLPTRLKFK
ncbi:hypothetical protein BVX98_06405 [bacterium F11]|nr:hypothetical protein BVX98_06405 [bacterium F11]